MTNNRGRTSLKTTRRAEDPMRDYDSLPPDLRDWLSRAVLPWRPKSVRRAFDKALARHKDRTTALRDLDLLQQRRVAKDASQIWGKDWPGQETFDPSTPNP